jgi:hypothetical protein
MGNPSRRKHQNALLVLQFFGCCLMDIVFIDIHIVCLAFSLAFGVCPGGIGLLCFEDGSHRKAILRKMDGTRMKDVAAVIAVVVEERVFVVENESDEEARYVSERNRLMPKSRNRAKYTIATLLVLYHHHRLSCAGMSLYSLTLALSDIAIPLIVLHHHQTHLPIPTRSPSHPKYFLQI